MDMQLRTILALPILLPALVVGCGDDGPRSENDAGHDEVDSGSDESLDADVDSEMDGGAGSALDASEEPDTSLVDSALSLEDAGPKLKAVTIRFVGRVGSAEFACGTRYPNQGSTAVAITPVDFRFYVQDLKLVTAGGDEVPVRIDKRDPWQVDGLAMIDFENATGSCLATPGMNREITGQVPEGNYVGVRFANGVPESLNHGDPAGLPPPLKQPGMQWSWLLGFRFVKAEVTQVVDGTDAGSALGDAGADAGVDGSAPGSDGGADAATAPGFALVHTGAVGCSGNPSAGNIVCTKPNRNAVRLDHFDPASNVIAVDIGALFGASDLSKDEECHSGATGCAPMARLGIDLETGLPLASQQVFRVE